MNNHLLFATSTADAKQECQRLGLDFAETTWVLNPHLLEDPEMYLGHTVHYTDLFRLMPACTLAIGIFGEEQR